jgi:nucleoside-diphosphate-sugar epimerase
VNYRDPAHGDRRSWEGHRGWRRSILAERGDDVRVIYRNPSRLRALRGVRVRRAKTDALDLSSMRRAVRGSEVLFHVAGCAGSSPVERVWELNAQGPVVRARGGRAPRVELVVVNPGYVLGVPPAGRDLG